MKTKNISLNLTAIVNTFQKYSVTIFIVVLTGGLASAVLILNSTLLKASDTTGYTSSADSTLFDQATIERVQQLHTSSDIVTETSPQTGRINPFAE